MPEFVVSLLRYGLISASRVEGDEAEGTPYCIG